MTDLNLPDWTVDEALAQARLALRFIRDGKRSMGKDYGYRNPILVLADAFAILDRDLGLAMPLPRDWAIKASVEPSDLRSILPRVRLDGMTTDEQAALDRLRAAVADWGVGR